MWQGSWQWRWVFVRFVCPFVVKGHYCFVRVAVQCVMVSRLLHPASRLLSTRLYRPCDIRAFSLGMRRCEAARPRLTNMLASDVLPPVQVASVAGDGIRLADGLLLPAACIFLEGKVFLWDFSVEKLQSWDTAHFAIFEAVTPRPGGTSSLVWRSVCEC
jgi:hypothetical protein